MAKRNYIDRDEYHREMVKCKKAGELSPRALELIQIHIDRSSLKYSRTYESDQEREDCMSSAMMDILQYWKNFKESNVVQFKMIRNAHPGDQIKIIGKDWELVIGFHRGPAKVKDNEIISLIRDTRNRTISAMADTINEIHKDKVKITVDKMKRKVTFQDVTEDQSLVRLEIKMMEKETHISTKEGNPKSTLVYQTVKKDYEPDLLQYLSDEGKELKSEKEIDDFIMNSDISVPIPITDASGDGIIEFGEPGNCFSYFTSVIRNGILKEFKKKNKGTHVSIGTDKGEVYSI